MSGSFQKLRAIIVDDEIDCIVALQHDIDRYCPEVEVIGQCGSGKEGIKAINQLQPDLVFLDIDMPYINGFEMLEMVPDKNFAVIFTTAHDQYALQAFRISAVDYLLKPIDYIELQKAIKKAFITIQKGDASHKLKVLQNQVRDLEKDAVVRVAIPTSDGLEFIYLDDIIYCQSDANYSRIFRFSADPLFIAKTLRYLEDMLAQYEFIRVHNSFLVNKKHIIRFLSSDGGYLLMGGSDSHQDFKIPKK